MVAPWKILAPDSIYNFFVTNFWHDCLVFAKFWAATFSRVLKLENGSYIPKLSRCIDCGQKLGSDIPNLIFFKGCIIHSLLLEPHKNYATGKRAKELTRKPIFTWERMFHHTADFLRLKYLSKKEHFEIVKVLFWQQCELK